MRFELVIGHWSLVTGRIALGAILAVALLGGCQAAKVAQPLTESVAGSDRETQMEFWHQLAQRPLTSNDEAFHALLLYQDKKDDCADYQARLDALRGRGLLPRGFAGAGDDALERGTLAVAITHMLDLKGGINIALLGPTPRYCTRLVQFKGIYPSEGSPNLTFSGAEFVGIIGRIEDYQRGN